MGVTTTKYRKVDGLPLSVVAKSGIPKERRALRVAGFGLGVRYGVFNHNLLNVLRGLTERVFRVEIGGQLVTPPKPAAGAFDCQWMREFRVRVVRLLGSCRPWSIEEFLETYRGAKQQVMRAAAESLATRAVSKADADIIAFVKGEKLDMGLKLDSAPRMIQPRSARYNCAVGPFLKAVEHHVYRAIADIWGGPTVMKGYNAVDQATHLREGWNQFARPVAIGLDASRFDQHVSVEALRYEHSVYNAVFGDPDLRKLLSMQLVNSGRVFTDEGIVKYRTEGCRMSGDMNTSLGNCLLMCAMVWDLVKRLGIRARLFNNGDDCVLIVEEGHTSLVQDRIPAHFLAYGFTMKVEEPVRLFERIEFCQTQPVYAAGRWVMCRKPSVCIDKDLVCLTPGNMSYRDWIGSVGQAGLALSTGMPVMQAFYSTLVKLGKPGSLKDGSGMAFLAKGLEPVVSSVTSEARLSFYLAFGVPPWMQCEMEMAISDQLLQLDLGLIERSQFGHHQTLWFNDCYDEGKE